MSYQKKSPLKKAKLDTKAQHIPFSELMGLLEYSEGLCKAYSDMARYIKQHIDAGVITQSEVAIIQQKVIARYRELEELTVTLEKEMDRRAKDYLGLKHGTTSITNLKEELEELDEMIKNRKEASAKSESAKIADKSSPMKLT